MASGLVQTNWALATPDCSSCFSFRGVCIDRFGIRGYMVERSIGQTDGMDLPGFWLHGRYVGQRACPPRRSFGGLTKLHTWSCDGARLEPAGFIPARGLSPPRGLRFGRESRGIFRRRNRFPGAVDRGAIQIGQLRPTGMRMRPFGALWLARVLIGPPRSLARQRQQRLAQAGIIVFFFFIFLCFPAG